MTNHEYNTPQKGSADWHVPLNRNFEKLDTDVEIRDSEANRDTYAPKDGAKFLATDTGTVYLGDGTKWSRLGAIGDAASGQPVLSFDESADAAAINALITNAHEDVAPMGVAYVVGPRSTVTVSSPVVLRSNVHLIANLKLADGSNTCAVKSRDFDSLTGTNTWQAGTASGTVPYNFGFYGHVDGNRANNTGSETTSVDGHPISGIAFYGKGYSVGGLGGRPTQVDRTQGVAFYSECGTQAGGTWDFTNLPEAQVKIRTWRANDHGIVWRGPHDSQIWAISADHLKRGWMSDAAPEWSNYYDDLYLHGYSSDSPQLHEANGRASYIYVDNEEAEVTGELLADHVKVAGGRAPSSLRIKETAHVGKLFARGLGKRSNTGHTGVVIDGGPVTIGELYTSEWNGDGAKLDGHEITIHAANASHNGGYGLNLGSTSEFKDSYLVATGLNGNGSAAISYGWGARNYVFARGWLASGVTGWDPESNPPRDGDYFDVCFNGGSADRTLTRGTTTASGDGSTTSFSIEHGLVDEPRFPRVMAKTPAAGRVDHLTTDGTAITVHYDAAPPAGANNLEWSWEAVL
ncbi:hypothetical protein [Halorussus sp. GCM10023401]|uniref:hypothetical protein n=1 Tax=Halorussus TaxID=1070314 RepID=UPI00360A37E6